MNYSVKKISDKIKNGKATVTVPGSKSITARALLIAALADGESTLIGAQLSDDCSTFLRAIKSLGIETETHGTEIKVKGCGGVLPVTRGEVYVGSAGTAARFITALAALSEGKFTLTASEQMTRRPQRALIEALESLGARFEFLCEEYCFPFVVHGVRVAEATVEVDVTRSSQYLSALLLCGVLCERLTVRAKGRHGMDYVAMTVEIMRAFGANAEEKDGAFTVSGGYRAREYAIEPDVSAACYFYAMNRLLGTEISVVGVSRETLQGDYKFIELVKSFDGGEVDMSCFSDQALTLAAISPFFASPTHITGVNHIRGQECDRIFAIISNLKALGVRCEETADGVIIYPFVPHGGVIETYGDHRVAMSFALVGLMTDGIIIKDAETCAKTFKEFFATLDALCKSLTE